jgi:hypothetical protein
MKELYVVIGKDDDGNEGVASYIHPQTKVMKPLVGSRQRLPVLLQVGKALAITSGRELQLVKFTKRGDLDVLTPEKL